MNIVGYKGKKGERESEHEEKNESSQYGPHMVHKIDWRAGKCAVYSIETAKY